MIESWPEGSESGRGSTSARPESTLEYYPATEPHSGATMVICPGGGYGGLAEQARMGARIAERPYRAIRATKKHLDAWQRLSAGALFLRICGASGGTRTPDLKVRNLSL